MRVVATWQHMCARNTVHVALCGVRKFCSFVWVCCCSCSREYVLKYCCFSALVMFYSALKLAVISFLTNIAFAPSRGRFPARIMCAMSIITERSVVKCVCERESRGEQIDVPCAVNAVDPSWGRRNVFPIPNALPATLHPAETCG